MNTRNFTKASGFSLIELMVVIAIVALLAAVAVPSYKSYINRSNAAEVNSLIGAQLDAWAVAQDTGATYAPPTGGLGQYISGVTGTGPIVFTLGTLAANLDTSLASGDTITFTGSGGGSLPYTWICAVSAASNAYPTNGIVFGEC
jgi:prepilin-type N-terminal cleavage/methylation domain-containing protein